MPIDSRKLAAAEAAAALVEPEMTVGLGSGSTATLAVAALGRRTAEGLRIRAVATSEQTARQARELGIPLIDLDGSTALDLTIDGADEVEHASLNLVKGLGGALLREKIVAASTRRLVIVADESKLVDHLGQDRLPIPVEVVPFGWQATARRLTDLGAQWTQRLSDSGEPFRSDGGHLILDCRFDRPDALKLKEQLDSVVGVVEHGLFLGMTSQVFVGTANGVVSLLRDR